MQDSITTTAFLLTMICAKLFPVYSSQEFSEKNQSVCISKWECNQWGTCIGLITNRTCTDSESCQLPPLKIEKQLCIPEGGIGEGINELFKNKKIQYLTISIFLLLIIAGIIAIILLKRKKLKKKKEQKISKEKRNKKGIFK